MIDPLVVKDSFLRGSPIFSQKVAILKTPPPSSGRRSTYSERSPERSKPQVSRSFCMAICLKNRRNKEDQRSKDWGRYGIIFRSFSGMRFAGVGVIPLVKGVYAAVQAYGGGIASILRMDEHTAPNETP